MVMQQKLEVQHRFFTSKTTTNDKRTVVFIGTEHASQTSSFISLSTFSGWKTPLGDVLNDTKMCEAILDKGGGDITANNVSFVREHSIENQIPFLQYFHQRSGKVF